jgi:hypothetical protein
MDGNVLKPAVDQTMRKLWIIWGALLGSLIILLGVCRFIAPSLEAGLGGDFPLDLLRNILLGVGILTLFGAGFFRKWMLRTRFGGPVSSPFSHASASNQVTVLNRYTLAVVVAWAMAESIGIYGVVLFLLGKQFMTLFVFAILAVAGLLAYRPNRHELEQLLFAEKRI